MPGDLWSPKISCYSVRSVEKCKLTPRSHLPVFIHKLLVELDNAAHPLRPRGEERGAEMQRPFLLAESGSRNDADAGGLEQAHGVELVRGAALGPGRLGRLG